MSASPGKKMASIKKARYKMTLATRQRQTAVRAFNSTVNLMRICMRTGTDTSEALDYFKAMKEAIKERDYEEVIFLQKEIFSVLRPKFGEIRQRSTYGAGAYYAPQPEVPMAQPVAPEPVAVAAPTEELVDPFEVEDVFVVYNDGRLIYHAAKTVDETCEAMTDDHIMSSMLVAIQHFIRDSMGKGGELGSFEYGENKILIEQGRYLFLAAVLSGKEPAGMREFMDDILRKFEGLYAGVIEEWDGDMCIFEDANTLVDPIANYHKNFRFKEKEEEEIRVMSALEFYQGFVRLKVAVKNKTETMISDSSLKLTYNKKALYLSHIEPDYSHEGADVDLGVVQPGEKKTVAFFLDPLICMESFIDGTLIYRDYRGTLKTVIMKRRPADIVCPLFYTDTNINTAMLKRLIDEVKYNDTRIYEIPKSMSAMKAFEQLKQAVQRHHVRFVREFIEKTPYVGEAWYYGKLHTVGEEMIIRATTRERTRSIEVFVASGNLATLTGLLAELSNDLKSMFKEFLTDGETEIKRLDDTSLVKEIEKSNLLIDKYLETEAPAEGGEVDDARPTPVPKKEPRSVPKPMPAAPPKPLKPKPEPEKDDEETSLEALLSGLSKKK